jgi:hypothetical protein
MGYTVEFADHTHNWYPVAVEGEPPTDEWVCIVQGCGYRIMPPAVLAAYVRARVAETLAPTEVLADEIENPRYQRPGMQRRRLWAARLRAALPAPDPESGQ